MRDFNKLLSQEDNNGSSPHPEYLIRNLRLDIDDCNLFDLPLNGYSFTWEKSRGSDGFIEECFGSVSCLF